MPTAGDPVPGQPGNFYNAFGGIYQVGLPAETAAWQANQTSGVSQSFATAEDAAAAWLAPAPAPAPAPIIDHPNAAAHEGQETQAQTLVRQITGIDSREPIVKPLIAPDVVLDNLPAPALPADHKPNLAIPAAAIAAVWLLL